MIIRGKYVLVSTRINDEPKCQCHFNDFSIYASLQRYTVIYSFLNTSLFTQQRFLKFCITLTNLFSEKKYIISISSSLFSTSLPFIKSDRIPPTSRIYVQFESFNVHQTKPNRLQCPLDQTKHHQFSRRKNKIRFADNIYEKLSLSLVLPFSVNTISTVMYHIKDIFYRTK